MHNNYFPNGKHEKKAIMGRLFSNCLGPFGVNETA